MTVKEHAEYVYAILKNYGDLNTSDGFFEEAPEIKHRILQTIENAIYRKMNEEQERLNQIYNRL